MVLTKWSQFAIILSLTLDHYNLLYTEPEYWCRGTLPTAPPQAPPGRHSGPALGKVETSALHFLWKIFTNWFFLTITFKLNLSVSFQTHTKFNLFRKAAQERKFPLAPMGVLAPWSAHARPSARPPSTLAEIFRHPCLQSHLQTSPPTPQKSYQKFQNPRTTFCPHLSAQI